VIVVEIRAAHRATSPRLEPSTVDDVDVVGLLPFLRSCRELVRLTITLN
jgi:hypothetical protein